MELTLSLDEIISLLAPTKIAGKTTLKNLTGIAALSHARPGDLSFLGNKKYKNEVPKTAATAVLLPPDYTGAPGENQVFLFVEKPSHALAQICARLEKKLWQRPPAGIHASALIDTGAILGSNVTISAYCVIETGAIIGDGVILEPFCHIGKHTKIGTGSWLKSRVTIADYCEIGQRVILHNGVVIGGEGFGYETIDGAHQKIPQVGNVIVEDDVEIGANSTVDRARFSTTRIGKGTKIDNLVQVGHNCVIGKHCILCGHVGLAGSSTLGDYVVLAGQVGIAGHLTIGSGTQIGAQSGVMRDIPAGQTVVGSPALPARETMKLIALQQRLPEFATRLGTLEKIAEIVREKL